MTDVQRDAERIRDLKTILLRIGVRPAARYYASAFRIFAGNFVGGAVVGAAATLIGFAVLGLDAHRGSDSALYHVLHAAQTVIQTVQHQIEQELR
jgi:hypothetical protein